MISCFLLEWYRRSCLSTSSVRPASTAIYGGHGALHRDQARLRPSTSPHPPHMPLPLRLPCVPSVAVSDAILAAQSAFAGGEFQPEEFPRAACLLVEAFEGGDNAIRLCTARLLERFRPYLGSNILTVEVCREYDSAVPSPFYGRLCASSERVFVVGGKYVVCRRSQRGLDMYQTMRALTWHTCCVVPY